MLFLLGAGLYLLLREDRPEQVLHYQRGVVTYLSDSLPGLPTLGRGQFQFLSLNDEDTLFQLPSRLLQNTHRLTIGDSLQVAYSGSAKPYELPVIDQLHSLKHEGRLLYKRAYPDRWIGGMSIVFAFVFAFYVFRIFPEKHTNKI